MTIHLKCPYIAEWESFSDEGEPITRSLGPEDILPLLVKGMSFAEVAIEKDAPLAVVKHAVAVIPDMMKWREQIEGQAPSTDEEVNMLRELQKNYTIDPIEEDADVEEKNG